jgi:hypothetical protein
MKVLLFFKSQLDSISAEIKNIQALLKDASVPYEIRCLCKKEPSIGSFGGFEVYGFGPGIETTKYLVWNEYQNNGNQSDWYLLYEEIEQRVAFEGQSHVPTGELITKIRKPLIECKTPIRIEMYDFLADFLEEVSKRLNLQDFKETQRGIHNAIRQFTSVVSKEL